MTVVAITSSRTSPGATSLAAGLSFALQATHERALLVEADPSGGVLALRFGLDVTPSLTTFGSDTRNEYSHDLVWRNTQDLRGSRVMTGPVDPRLARSWVERVTPLFVEHLPGIGAPVVIDLGWVGEDGASLPLAAAADVTLIVTRPQIAEVQALLFQVRQLQTTGTTVGLVTVGTGPNDPQEVAAVAGIPLIAVLPDDPQVASALRGAKFAPAKFRRSLLWRTIGAMAESLVDETLVYSRASDIASAFFGTEAPTHATDEVYAAAAAAGVTPPQPQFPPPVGQPPSPPHTVPAAPMSPAPPVPPMPAQPAPAMPAPPMPAPPMPAPAMPAPPMPAPAMPAPVSPPVSDAPSYVVEVGGAPSQPAPVPPPSLEPTAPQPVAAGAELLLPSGERFQLRADTVTTVGRNRICDIVLHDSQVSRRHGSFTHTGNSWHYTDLGSSNGSVVNGQPCAQATLTSGDELYIGHARLVFQTTINLTMENA